MSYRNTLTDAFAAQFKQIGAQAYAEGVALDQIEVNPTILAIFSEDSQQAIKNAIAQGFYDAASEACRKVAV